MYIKAKFCSFFEEIEGYLADQNMIFKGYVGMTVSWKEREFTLNKWKLMVAEEFRGGITPMSFNWGRHLG